MSVGGLRKLLDKSKVLFERDEKGELMPKTVKLVGTEEEIKIVPLTRAEWIKLTEETKSGETSKDQDGEIISKHLVEPKLSDGEVNGMKAGYATAIVTTILKHSGLSVDKKTEGDELKKP